MINVTIFLFSGVFLRLDLRTMVSFYSAGILRFFSLLAIVSSWVEILWMKIHLNIGYEL